MPHVLRRPHDKDWVYVIRFCWREDKKTAMHLRARLCWAHVFARTPGIHMITLHFNLLRLQLHYIIIYVTYRLHYITVQCIRSCFKHIHTRSETMWNAKKATRPCLVPRPNWSKSSPLESFRPQTGSIHVNPIELLALSLTSSNNQHIFTISHNDNTHSFILLWGLKWILAPTTLECRSGIKNM